MANNLSESQFNELKASLEKEAGELEAGISTKKKPEDFGSDVDHFDEEADEAESLSNSLDVVQTFEGRLRDVEAALEKMERGSYGTCEKCGEAISFELLKIDAESKLCKACKQSLQK